MQAAGSPVRRPVSRLKPGQSGRLTLLRAQIRRASLGRAAPHESRTGGDNRTSAWMRLSCKGFGVFSPADLFVGKYLQKSIKICFGRTQRP